MVRLGLRDGLSDSLLYLTNLLLDFAGDLFGDSLGFGRRVIGHPAYLFLELALRFVKFTSKSIRDA